MADVQIESWADLITEFNAATEATTFSIANDIDCNDEYPTGITTAAKCKNYGHIIEGNGHKIKNLFSNNNITILSGYGTSKRVTINEVDFENVYVTGSAKAFGNAVFQNCNITASIFNTSLFTGKVTLRECGVKCEGSGDSSIFGISSDNFFMYNTNCELTGLYKSIYTYLQNTYIDGDIKQVGTSGAFSFGDGSYLSIINAIVEMNEAPTASNALALIYNTERFTLPSGSSFPATMLGLTTDDIESPSTLRSYSFPCRG